MDDLLFTGMHELVNVFGNIEFSSYELGLRFSMNFRLPRFYL